MTDFQKSLSRFMYVTLLVAIAVAVWVLVRRRPEEPKGYAEGVTATGSCIVRTKPDAVEVTIGVQQGARTAKAAKNDVKSRARKVIAALTKGGVAAKDIRTDRYSLEPRWDEGTHKLSWQAEEALRVRIRSIDKAADLVDAAVEAGAARVGRLEYVVDDLNALRAKGRAKAAKVARDKAAQLTSAMGGKLRRLRSVDESYPSDYDYYWGYWSGYTPHANVMAQSYVPGERAGGAPDTAPEELTIQPGEMVVTVVIRATYELE
jgi:uncharacterized protein YggE